MACLIYREHTIISSASEDEITQQWLPLISISWMKETVAVTFTFSQIAEHSA